MKILKKIVLWLLIVIALVSLLAQLLPADWKVVRSTETAASPESVYPQIATVRHWEQWNSFSLEDPAIVNTYSGPETGVGASVEWKSKKFGDGGAKITQAFPPSGIEYDMHFAAFKEHSTGRILVTPTESGSRITYSVEGRYGHNPVHRIMGLFVDTFLGKFFERSLAHLKAVSEASPVTPSASEESVPATQVP